jgi:SAM-dependent methyltransferase
VAVTRYTEALRHKGAALKGKRVLVFGYGGRFDIGLGLLEAGAGHVALCEKHVVPDDTHNVTLLQRYSAHLFLDRGRPRPRPELMTLLQADIREVRPSSDFPPFDLVLSNSVYEHLDDVEGITGALAALTRPDGLHLHFVDLRDHFFKYPFEMLCYSEDAWRNWLNPTSNHNRFRLWDYRRVFEKYFEIVELEVIERDEASFERTRPRIRAEFISGNLQEDCVTLIGLAASRPRKRDRA